MLNELLTLLESKLARLKSEHETRLLFLSQGSLDKFNPMQKRTYCEAVSDYTCTAGDELTKYIEIIQKEVLTFVEQLMLPLSSETATAVLSIAYRQFNVEIYPQRLKLFEDAMVRKGGRCGLRIDEWGLQNDLHTAKHTAGTQNHIRRSLEALKDDLDMLRLRTEIKVSGEETPQETKIEQANRLIKLEPNIFGIGLNLNYLIRRFLGKKN